MTNLAGSLGESDLRTKDDRVAYLLFLLASDDINTVRSVESSLRRSAAVSSGQQSDRHRNLTCSASSIREPGKVDSNRDDGRFIRSQAGGLRDRAEAVAQALHLFHQLLHLCVTHAAGGMTPGMTPLSVDRFV